MLMMFSRGLLGRGAVKRAGVGLDRDLGGGRQAERAAEGGDDSLVSAGGRKLGVPPPKKTVVTLALRVASRQRAISAMRAST
jgi:hypothetical protein